MATATRNRADRDAEKAAEYAALTAKLEETVAAVEAGDAALLAKLEHFAAIYSERNAMLIITQDPEATEVAGFVAWKQRGRQVRKGEHGIRILAPAGTGKADVAEADDKVKVEDGAAPLRRYFRMVSIFDVRQTDPIEV